MLKLFSLKVKDNDPMLVAYDIKAIMHEIKASCMRPDLPLAKFLNSMYPNHSNYIDSLQSKRQVKRPPHL